jgi:ParB family transcriptional regulator, chromosome partitioning protein
MTIPSRPQRIASIPIERINVLNPRTRNRRQYREIVDNIDAIGLKRPVTVRRHPGAKGGDTFDLICGEGRLEAFRMLGATEIPAVVIDADEDDSLVMSLVENIARRQHRPIDIMHEIGPLRHRGYNDAQIAEKIGCTPSWVNMVGQLLEHGEERLLAAVETGLIPVSLAIDIARAGSEEAQTVLLEAYEGGKLKGKKLGVVRRMLDQRMRQRKGVPDSGLGRRSTRRRITATEMMRLYQKEAEKQRVLVKKSDFTQARLLFTIEALKDLVSEEGFGTLLKAEGLDTMPRALATRVYGRAGS